MVACDMRQKLTDDQIKSELATLTGWARAGMPPIGDWRARLAEAFPRLRSV